MGWIPAEQWARLKAGVDCPMCADMHLEVNAFSYLVAELERSYVRLVRNQYRRGWTILALKRHAAELFELAEDEHAEFWREVACVARALDDLYRPVKINYSVLGNLCPHIHCHLVLQFGDDDPHTPPDMQEREVLLSEAEYARLVGQLRAALGVGAR